MRRFLWCGALALALVVTAGCGNAATSTTSLPTTNIVVLPTTAATVPALTGTWVAQASSSTENIVYLFVLRESTNGAMTGFFHLCFAATSSSQHSSATYHLVGTAHGGTATIYILTTSTTADNATVTANGTSLDFTLQERGGPASGHAAPAPFATYQADCAAIGVSNAT